MSTKEYTTDRELLRRQSIKITALEMQARKDRAALHIARIEAARARESVALLTERNRLLALENVRLRRAAGETVASTVETEEG